MSGKVRCYWVEFTQDVGESTENLYLVEAGILEAVQRELPHLEYEGGGKFLEERIVCDLQWRGREDDDDYDALQRAVASVRRDAVVQMEFQDDDDGVDWEPGNEEPGAYPEDRSC